MRVLVACEFSGIVRDAFIQAGHEAWSCDLLPSETPGLHIQGDVLKVLDQGWDLLIAHPPCTHLAVSGARWFKDKQTEQAEALEFVRLLLDAPVPMIALENPISIISSRIRKPDQIIQPWQFGHGEDVYILDEPTGAAVLGLRRGQTQDVGVGVAYLGRRRPICRKVQKPGLLNPAALAP